DEPWFEALRRGPRITTTTADDGTFVLDGLESGDVPLIAEHERYVASEPIVVEVPLGGEVSDLVVELRQGGSLRGRAYTREGEPSAGGQIMLVHASEVRPITRPLDPEGRFEIVRIEPGSYQAVSFPDLSNELTDGNDDSLTSRMLTEAVTELIEIREGEVTELVLGSPLSDPVRVSGQVRAGGIGSQYSLTFLPESDVGGFERMRQLRTDSAGRYDLVLHEPGNFVISVTRGLAPSPRISEQTFLRTIPDTDEYRLDFDLPVTSLGGRVVDLEGLPLIGVPVRAASVEGSTYASLVGLASASTVTDENGRYVFELLPPGTYSVQAGGPGSAISRSVDDTRGASVAPEVVLTEGAQIDDLDFELSTGLSLRGIVLDAAGDPVRQANVFVRNEDGHSLESLSTLQTDATGAFQVRGLGGGLHSLMARKGALATPIVTGIEARPGAPAVELRLGPATDLIVRVDVDGEFDPGARVIVEDEAGQPVSALSSLEEEVRRLNAFRSDEFRFGPLPPGRYRVIARASDGRVEDRRVDLRGQTERRLRLRLD
ncbi:MAG: carboxypeptidase regulatory-like domain-containing protein, partial [Planctomycetota bacterium]